MMIEAIGTLTDKYSTIFWDIYGRYNRCEYEVACEKYKSEDFSFLFVMGADLDPINRTILGVELVLNEMRGVCQRKFTSKKRKEHLLTHLLVTLGTFAMDGLHIELKIDPEQKFEEFMRFLLLQNRVYGDENLIKHGFVGGIVRLGDKLSRFQSIYGRRATDTLSVEKAQDAWRDVLGYSINLVRLYLEGRLSLYGRHGRL
jgi:hypothetical protein